MIWLAVALGGAVGAVARHWMTSVIRVSGLHEFPLAIFVVNTIGCFAIGLLAGLLASARVTMGETGRTFLAVGVLGGFTTFSSFSLDTFTLLRSGQTALGVLNACGQVGAGLVALWVGYTAGTWRP
jgi:CrcB protein